MDDPYTVGGLAAGAGSSQAATLVFMPDVKIAVNQARTRALLSPLAEHPGLETAAKTAALAMADAVRRNPAAPQAPAVDADPLMALPGLARISWQLFVAPTAAALISQAATSSLCLKPELTHMVVGVAKGTVTGGQTFFSAAVVCTEQLPRISPELLNQGRREFSIRCHQCGAMFLTRVDQPRTKLTGSVSVVCSQCDLVSDLFGIDTREQYHRPPWFLRDFCPQRIRSPWKAWEFVLTHLRYVEDVKQYGRNEIWQLAEQTYRRRQGDCEDSSILLADWLCAAGYQARVVLGQHQGKGHAWVVVSQHGHDYILECTGGRANFRARPPSSKATRDYLPMVQFDRASVWFRTSNDWTADYASPQHWKRGPWPVEAVSSDRR